MDDECSICLEVMNSDLVILSCNHKYHQKCIFKWLRKK